MITLVGGNKEQRTKVGESFSMRHEIICGVPQGSILGPLLYFLFLSGFSMSNYADDCSPYESSPTIEDVLHKLEKSSVIYYLMKVGINFVLMLETNVFQISEGNFLGVYFD